MKILSKIKAFWAVFQFALTVAIIIILMYMFNRFNWAIRRVWAKSQKFLIGYKTQIIGKANADADILLLNHQSLLDIVVLEEHFPRNISWVAKKEIGNIPFFGKILSIPKMIAIDRESKRSLLILFKNVKDRLKNNRTIAMFPEGTRGDGTKLLPFKDGPKMICEKLNLKIQPVVVVNSNNILNSQKLTSQFGTIKIIYLDLIDKKEENWYQQMKESMKKVLENELANNSSNR